MVKIKSIAYHEAGHVLANILTGEKFISVTIKSHTKQGAHVKNWAGDKNIPVNYFEDIMIPDPDSLLKLFPHAFISAAGTVAQAVFLGERDIDGAGGDMPNIVDPGIKWSDKFSKYYMAFLGSYIGDLFRAKENRLKIEAIANALLKRKTLSYTEIINLLKKLKI